MDDYDVHLRFESEDDRERVMDVLRTLNLPDGEVMENEGDAWLRLRAGEENAALVRAQILVRQDVCRRADVDPERVNFSTGGWV